jgi:hypothetical protein
MTSKEIDDLINQVRFGFDMEGQTAINEIAAALTERDDLKVLLAECEKVCERKELRLEAVEARLAEYVRRARGLLEGGLGPIVGEGGVIEFLEELRDLAAEKVEP